MREYQVKWRVRGSMAHPHYEGIETVWAEDEEQAVQRAQRNVHRGAFQDLHLGSVEIVEVSRKLIK